jgi:hypothetical protein
LETELWRTEERDAKVALKCKRGEPCYLCESNEGGYGQETLRRNESKRERVRKEAIRFRGHVDVKDSEAQKTTGAENEVGQLISSSFE